MNPKKRVIDINPPQRSGFTPFPETVAPTGSDKRREQDLRMMKSPQHWPHRILPIKRWDGTEIQCAIWDGKKFYDNTYLFSALHWLDTNGGVETTPEALIADGWTVD